uniref:GPI ethanolamine phosphate transferase 1 n=1 Tax=Trichuris muris TaxID=70415 RepID=A0A5S6Q8I3_TRIMR
MRSYGANAAPPADRLVLFVADGLRAQSFFECNSDGSVKSPFLRRMSRKGTWGTSITRVPTESRPGYVAIISGFPEDIGAVMYGWRENPVAFDSFFNQSRYTWSWGSSEIVSMFSKAESQDHVFTQSYPTHMQEFYREAYRLDDWVFRKFEAFLNSTLTNDTLHDMVHQNKVVFFLNLLAMDVIGHSSKPHSEMYREGIRMLDSGIEEVYRLVEGYFADQRTVYVFTADHGMTDWGSHGAGSPQETLTPVVIWGSGINQLPDAVSSACWPSSPVDINQVDIAPLMSALIGAAFPANSIGVVPLEYLNVSSRSKALVMLANFRQLLEQLLIQKRRKRQMYWSIFFREFPGMTMQRVRTLTDALEYLLSKQRYVTIVDICKQWIPTVLQGMQYYHQYERRLLTCCIVASFCAWLLCMFSFLVVSKRLDLTLSHCNYFDMGLMGGLLFLLWCNSFRATFMLYAMMPFYLFHAANLRLNFREEGVLGSKDTAVRVDDVRRAFFFISFLFLGFFGTGNIASVNSFDPNFIILFVQVYRPFVMCALLIVKMIIPFMIACCSLCALSMFTNSKMETLYWLVVIVGDMQAVQFLLLLKDTGSWLEIGESISHYLIAMTMTAVVMLLSYGARFYTKCQIFAPKKHLP